MALGDWKHLSRKQRLEKIKVHGCVPTPDPLALRLLRVLWLHHIHYAFGLFDPWKRVLDIGCHDGFVTRWLVDEPSVETLVGIDICEQSIVWAQELVKVRAHPEKAHYIHDDWMTNKEVRELELFDAIVCFELIEHLDLEETTALFKFIDEHLELGGGALITTPNIEGPVGETNADEQHINLFSLKRLEAWFLNQIKTPSNYDIRIDHVGAHLHLMWRKGT